MYGYRNKYRKRNWPVGIGGAKSTRPTGRPRFFYVYRTTWQPCSPPRRMKCALGVLQPVAYSPGTTDGPVFDALITRCIAAGTELSFRFYPQTDTYLSQAATTVSFVLVVDVAAGSLLRLVAAVGSMTLAGRAQGAPSWNAISATSLNVTASASSSLYVFMNSRLPITAMGLVYGGFEPIFPAAVPAQYTVAAVTTSPLTDYVYYANAVTPIPENWGQAWRSMRAQTYWAQAGPAPYGSVVDAAEDALRVRIIPCQLVPIAFRPYLPNSGVWSLLVTSTIPARAALSIWANNWSDLVAAGPWWTWSAGVYDIPTGTVLTFTGLGGGNVPCASTGTIATGASYDSSAALYALTAYAETEDAPITGTYTTAYYDIIPVGLEVGVAIRECLWPMCASIIVATAACSRRECNPTILAIQANAIPLVRWMVQPIPSSFPLCKATCPYPLTRCC